MFISILVVTAIATALGLNEFKGVVGQIPSIAPTFMQMDFEDTNQSTCTVEQVDNKEYENDAHHTCCK
jgi:xanthine/uracil/vitamin C permease (AzgA family)